MACKATMRQHGDVVIVDLSGRITLGDCWGMLRKTIRSLAEQGHKQVLVNMKEVSYIDSAGLGELVGAYATLAHQGGHLKLVHAENKVRDVLLVTKLYTVFEIFADEATALQSFGGAARGAA